MNEMKVFCRQVRERSAEHRQAIIALRAFPGQMVSILRQELDSLVRVIFLLAQRDRELVDLANGLHGWTKSVYKFGCAFIHLSSLHDYRARDPLHQIAMEERDAILAHLRHYHGGPCNPTPTFDDIVPLLPRVYEKIAANLECYVRDLMSDKDLVNRADPAEVPLRRVQSPSQ